MTISFENSKNRPAADSGEPYRFLSADKFGKRAALSEKTNINRFRSVMDFEPVIGLFSVPCASHEVDVIVGSVFNEFDFQPAESAVIGDGGAVFTMFLFRHFVTS